MPDPGAYDLDEFGRRIPTNRAELYVGYSPWKADMEGWARTVDEHLEDEPGRPVTRTVWDDPDNHEARVLVDVVERSSAEEAMETLVERLGWNQMAELSEGPRGLGYISFVHPEGLPAATYFVRGNVCITVISYGRASVTTTPVAERLDRRLRERPGIERTELPIDVERRTGEVGDAIPMRLDLRNDAVEGRFVKIFSDNATLAVIDGQPVVRPIAPGTVSVEAIVVGPGRETTGGSLEIEAR